MKLKYFVYEENITKGKDWLFDANGELPVVGQRVYVRDNRNSKHLGPTTVYEVIRVDISVSLEQKLLIDVEPSIKNRMAEESLTSEEEEEHQIGGHVFAINFVEKLVEFSKNHAEILLQKFF